MCPTNDLLSLMFAVMSYRMEHVQATVLGPHSCSLELNISSKSRPGLFHPTFCRSDSTKVNLGMDFEDLSEGLRISTFVLNLYAGDQAVSTPKQCLLE